MKLLTLIVITLTINFSVLVKSSFSNSSLNSTELVNIIDQQSEKLYNKGKIFVNDMKNIVMLKLSKYSQIVKVAFLNKSFNKNNRSMLSEKKIRHNSGNSHNKMSKEGNHCFI
jgi:hypothetical protein